MTFDEYLLEVREYLLEVRAGIDLDRPSRIAFNAVVDPYQLAHWFADRARVTARRGGGYEITRAGENATGRILDLVPGRRVLISWDPVQPSHIVVPGSELEFFVEPTPTGSRVQAVWWKIPTTRSEPLTLDLSRRLDRLRETV
ncbi:SRPBCC domain-containing protein [Leifsonia sp. EB34]|uniref:SRPBCC domain-containing protein n=1 Tax=Leifsonia sp. EB34 TaxID=3156303 RepID=UPI0035147B01